jgi:hypothetical protein
MNDLAVVLNIAQWLRLKSFVPDSVSSPITRRVYNMAQMTFAAYRRRVDAQESRHKPVRSAKLPGWCLDRERHES